MSSTGLTSKMTPSPSACCRCGRRSAAPALDTLRACLVRAGTEEQLVERPACRARQYFLRPGPADAPHEDHRAIRSDELIGGRGEFRGGFARLRVDREWKSRGAVMGKSQCCETGLHGEAEFRCCEPEALNGLAGIQDRLDALVA